MVDITNLPTSGIVSGVTTGSIANWYALNNAANQLTAAAQTVTTATVVDNTRTALARFHALAGYRFSKAVYVGCCGDSWTFGTGSSGDTGRWISRLHDRLANYYYLPSGSTQGAVAYINNPGAGGVGIRIIGNGHSGATTATYLPPQEITDLMKMQPAMVIHAIGLNDQAQSFTKATYKANLLAAVNEIRAQSSAPVIQLLVRNPELKRSTQTYPWSDYGDAMTEIVATSPNDLVYVDLTSSFEQAQIRSSDPLSLMLADGGHPNDAWHAFIAELLFGAIRPALSLGKSGVASPPADLPPLWNTAVASATGTASVGNVLTAGNGTWVATPDSYTYQWRRSGVDISGATASTYTLVSADSGLPVSVAVTAVKASYASRKSVSASVTVSGAAQSLTNSTAPAITGTASAGNTLSVSNGTWSATPDSYTYQWTRGGANVSGATANTYALTSADNGTSITCVVTAVKAGYTSGSATAAAVTISGTATLTNTTAPTITGSPVVGQTLTSSTGAWSVTPDSYTYQWSGAGTPISGATASTYVPVTGDIGNALTVTVTAVKSGYTSASATSAATAAVAAAAANQFADTFTGTDGNVWDTTKWTKRAGNGTITLLNNQGKLTTPATASDYVLAFATGMTVSTDQELYAEFVTPAAGYITFGVSTANFAYTAPNNGYFVQLQVGSGYQAKRSLSGTASQIDYQGSPTVVASTGYRIRFKRSNSTSGTPTIQYRTWLATDSAEPTTWKMTYTDATPPGAGAVWVLLTNPGTAVAQSATVDNITVV